MLRYFNPAGAHPSGLLGESPVNPPQNLVPVITETAIGRRASMTVFVLIIRPEMEVAYEIISTWSILPKPYTLGLKYIFDDKQQSPVDIYNVGIGNGLTVLEIIDAFEKVTGEKLSYQKGPRRPGDVMAIYSDYSKAAANLGWKPSLDVEDIMKTAWVWEKRRSQK